MGNIHNNDFKMLDRQQQFIAYFLKVTPLTESEQQAIVESMEIKTFKKHDFIVKENNRNNDTFFVLDGLVRAYKTIDGNEITTNFYKENQWIVALTGFIENASSPYSLVCIDETTVVVGNEKKALDIFKRFPQFETVSRIIMENAFLEQQQWMTSYLTDTPEQRYLNLLATQPHIFQKVPQYQIASYIGLKPESLSRMRKRLFEKDKQVT